MGVDCHVIARLNDTANEKSGGLKYPTYIHMSLDRWTMYGDLFDDNGLEENDPEYKDYFHYSFNDECTTHDLNCEDLDKAIQWCKDRIQFLTDHSTSVRSDLFNNHIHWVFAFLHFLLWIKLKYGNVFIDLSLEVDSGSQLYDRVVVFPHETAWNITEVHHKEILAELPNVTT